MTDERMKQLQVRDFRASFTTLEEPAEVFVRNDRKGTWYPAGTEPKAIGSKQLAELEEEVARLKRMLADRSPVATRRIATEVPKSVMTDGELRDWIKTLPEQDQAFFASRLGIKK